MNAGGDTRSDRLREDTVMEPEKPLEEKIEELSKELPCVDTVRSIMGANPFSVSEEELVRIIKADPAQVEHIAKRILSDGYHIDTQFISEDGTYYYHSRKQILTRGLNCYSYLSSLPDAHLAKVVQAGKALQMGGPLRRSTDVMNIFFEAVAHFKNIDAFDFDKWSETGKEMLKKDEIAGIRYFAYSKEILDSKVDFDEWVKKGKEVIELNVCAGREYFLFSKEIVKSKIDPFEWADIGKEITRKNIRAGIEYFTYSKWAAELGMNFSKWVEAGKEITELDTAAGNAYFRCSHEVLKFKIDFNKWLEIGKEIIKINDSAGWQYFSISPKILESKIDFFTWADFGKDILKLDRTRGTEFFDLDKNYFLVSEKILNSKIDFFKWAELGKELISLNNLVGHNYFLASPNVLESKFNFFKWAKVGKKLAEIDQEVSRLYFAASKVVFESVLKAHEKFDDWVETGEKIAELDKYAGQAYFSASKVVQHSRLYLGSKVGFDEWVETGKKTLAENKAAGLIYFKETESFKRGAAFKQIIELAQNCVHPEDYNFLKFGRFEKKDICALKYLLNNPKQKELVLPESIEHNIFYTEDLGKEVEEIGRKLFRKFYFAVKNKNNVYAEKYKDSEFKEVFDAIRGYSFQGKNLRKELSKIFKEHVGSKDIPDVETRTFQKVMDDIDKIEIKKVKHSISDFFNHLSSYLSGINPFTKIRMHAHKRFADELIDNRTLDSCTFGPTGSKREACLGYSADPNIEMIFLSTYLHDKFIDNIGVAYLVNTKENVWLLDGVDAGPTAKNLPGLDWKEVFYDDLINLIKSSENPPDKVFMNVNLGPKKTPNEFLEYVCKRKGIKYKKEVTRIKVNESEKIKKVLNKPLLSESNPAAYKALNTDKAYLEAWYDCAGSPWNIGRGEVEVIELLNLLDF